jgi:hypothetical protein
MRALAAVAILAFGVVGVTGAGAADLRVGHGGLGYDYSYEVFGRRAAPVIIYDYEPGVVVRAYWLPPWRNRHYFPFGRDRIVRHAASRPTRARSYRRYWSNDWAFIDEFPPPALHARDRVPLPPPRPRAIPPSLP